MIERTFDEVQDSRIINGVEAPLFSRPYQASLQVHIPNRGWFHICGAAIIDVDRLVSAAHCLIPFPADRLRVEVGVLNLKAPPLEYTQFIDVLKVEWHEDYLQDDYLSYPNDIGVIYLKHPMVYNENVQPAKIAPVGQKFDEQECSISGWGSTIFGGRSSAKLQEANMTKWTYERCLQVHQDNGYFVGPKHACVKGKDYDNVSLYVSRSDYKLSLHVSRSDYDNVSLHVSRSDYDNVSLHVIRSDYDNVSLHVIRSDYDNVSLHLSRSDYDNVSFHVIRSDYDNVSLHLSRSDYDNVSLHVIRSDYDNVSLHVCMSPTGQTMTTYRWMLASQTMTTYRCLLAGQTMTTYRCILAGQTMTTYLCMLSGQTMTTYRCMLACHPLARL
ncbi:Chymotrypsin-1 [Bulinus truncatus]|nr:Chymotrypsin-1 [Bulinus truncatus]